MEKFYCTDENEKPLDNPVIGGGYVGILRKIAFIGDSLSSGEFEIYKETNNERVCIDNYDYSIGQYIAREAGITAYNFSVGGMHVRWYMDGFAQLRGYFNPELAANAYVIALGCNDFILLERGDLEFGSIDDVHPDNPEQNAHTFCGYYGQIISKYKAIQPHAKFFFETLPVSNWSANEEIHNKHTKFMYQLCDIFENSYVIDLHKYAPPYDDEFQRKFYLSGHMSPLGYMLSAKMIMSYIDYIIRHNPEDFKYLGLMEYDFHPTIKSGKK
ncbi:MAG: SGNH/GDSL hydrolase family protein [Oscillospiraceae bacterium]|nr:SGNH/GDSL hydrolase family protein [Candidatus Equicaccousia limihippi]